MSIPFDLSGLAPSSDIWGPPGTVPDTLRFSNIPFAPFSKGDKLGKAADWSQNDFVSKDQKEKIKRGQRDYFRAFGASAAHSFAAEDNDDGEEFSVVDNSKTTAQKNQSATVLKGRRTQAPQHQRRQFGNNQNKQPFNNNNNNNNKRGGFSGGRRSYWRDEKQERVRDSSVKIDDAWAIVSDVELTKLTKLNFEVGSGEEIDTYGSLNVYNKSIERASGTPLKIIDKATYNITASEDPVIQELNSKKTATVYTTDSVITQLMSASKSVYSWDIVVTKKDGVIFFDKRDGSAIDRITVDENAQDAPSDSQDSNINNVQNLALEATYLNQNFLANVVFDDKAIKLNHPNPFHVDSKEPLLSKGYKYKKYVLRKNEEEENPPSIVIRTEIDSKDTVNNQLLSVKAVNEYSTAGLDWKTKFSSQRGAIIAAELKNNNNKFAKWANQAILAGVDSIKLGFISRTNFKDNTKHTIVGVASYKPQDLALQISLSPGNGWGIVKSYIDIIAAQEDGKYLIVKHPNIPKLTVYKVPEDSFTTEE